MLSTLRSILGLATKDEFNQYYGCVFDSSSVSVVFFSAGAPVNWFSERLAQGIVANGRIIDQDQFSQVLRICINKCGRTVKNIVFGVDGANCYCSFISVRQKRNPEKQVTHKDLMTVYAEAARNSIDSAVEQVYAATGNPDIELECAFTETTMIKLDEIVCPSPEGKLGAVLEISTFSTFCEPAYLEALADAANNAGLVFKTVVPVDFAVAKHLDKKMTDAHNSVIISIRRDYTNLSVVFGGSLIQRKTLPLGSGAFERELEFWVQSLELLFKEFLGIKTFSPNVYICGSDLERTDFWEMLEWYEWEKQIPFKSKPVFTKLDAAFFDFPLELKGNLLVAGVLGICKE
ncbi:TPA: hypothetical protein DCY43_01165 [candidate division WWE3 bacterium]|uniref:Pilus assembly protein PilM n=1 Tax=candidate division WWE3 bacterium TaxID=2053526 RepID=A0A351JST2_UNCKA|nr:hypothetical protein [candidate division WWE3 bacterium]